jgi:hypothetical protein
MMDLRNLTDESLDLNTFHNVKKELEYTTIVLHHLKEVDRRRLYAKLKFHSLFDYATRRLGYSSDQADRRIAAMRLMRELPEIEAKISSGALTLTNIGMARTLFKKEKFSKSDKLQFFEKIEHKSVREAARLIATVSPQSLRRDQVRPVAEDKDEYKFLASPELRAKLKKLEGILAHSHPGISLGDLVEKLADLGLEKWDKTAAPRDSRRQSLRKVIFRRDKKCSNCGSAHALELDHRYPKAMGGAETPENLRLLCRNCNQRAAIEIYGLNKMERYRARILALPIADKAVQSQISIRPNPG